MATPSKEQILGIAHGIPVSVLIKYINNGFVTLQDLKGIHLAESKIQAIEKAVTLTLILMESMLNLAVKH